MFMAVMLVFGYFGLSPQLTEKLKTKIRILVMHDSKIYNYEKNDAIVILAKNSKEI